MAGQLQRCGHITASPSVKLLSPGNRIHITSPGAWRCWCSSLQHGSQLLQRLHGKIVYIGSSDALFETKNIAFIFQIKWFVYLLWIVQFLTEISLSCIFVFRVVIAYSFVFLYIHANTEKILCSFVLNVFQNDSKGRSQLCYAYGHAPYWVYRGSTVLVACSRPPSHPSHPPLQRSPITP